MHVCITAHTEKQDDSTLHKQYKTDIQYLLE